MEESLVTKINFICKDLFEEARNNFLLYGNPKKTSLMLREIYKQAQKREEFLCSWHNASKIKKPMDFFEPVLRLKYGKRYDTEIVAKPWFKELISRNEKGGVFQLASLCGREENSKYPNEKKTPIFFILGMEELLFKMDYRHLNKTSLQKLLTGDFMEQPLPKGFGDCVRGSLHQTGKGIFYGTVRNPNNIKFRSTLGNYNYLFYCENFYNFFID